MGRVRIQFIFVLGEKQFIIELSLMLFLVYKVNH